MDEVACNGQRYNHEQDIQPRGSRYRVTARKESFPTITDDSRHPSKRLRHQLGRSEVSRKKGSRSWHVEEDQDADGLAWHVLHVDARSGVVGSHQPEPLVTPHDSLVTGLLDDWLQARISSFRLAGEHGVAASANPFYVTFDLVGHPCCGWPGLARGMLLLLDTLILPEGI